MTERISIDEGYLILSDNMTSFLRSQHMSDASESTLTLRPPFLRTTSAAWRMLISLPEDILLDILNYIDVRDLLTLRKVSTHCTA